MLNENQNYITMNTLISVEFVTDGQNRLNNFKMAAI